jgi:hypothetical protein
MESSNLLISSESLALHPDFRPWSWHDARGNITIRKIARFRTIQIMRIYVLALDNVFDLGLSAILDGFQIRLDYTVRIEKIC